MYTKKLPIDDWYSMKEKEYNERMAAEAESKHNLLILSRDLYNDIVDVHLNDDLNESNLDDLDRRVSIGDVSRDDMISYIDLVDQRVRTDPRFNDLITDFFKIKYKTIIKCSNCSSDEKNNTQLASQIDREALVLEEEFIKAIYPGDAEKTDIIRNFIASDYRKFTYVAVILSAYANLQQAIDKYSMKEDS